MGSRNQAPYNYFFFPRNNFVKYFPHFSIFSQTSAQRQSVQGGTAGWCGREKVKDAAAKSYVGSALPLCPVSSDFSEPGLQHDRVESEFLVFLPQYA